MLEVRGLRVSYGASRAVDGIDFDVQAGETVSLLGPNGAGKTSTLRALSRLVASSGEIVFDGEAISKEPPEVVARRGLIHVPEGRRVFPTLTVHENLQVGTIARAGRSDGYEIDEVYDLFTPLQRLRNRSGWALSGGEQQMVAIGRGLVAAPRLLLLDEPSLGLAPIIITEVMRALKQVQERTPMLLVEQNTTMALKVCSRAQVLVNGRIVLAGDASEMSDRQALIDSYLGQSDISDSH